MAEATTQSTSGKRADEVAIHEISSILVAQKAMKNIPEGLVRKVTVEEATKGKFNVSLVKVPYPILQEIRKNFDSYLSALEDAFPDHTVFIVRQRPTTFTRSEKGRKKVKNLDVGAQEGIIRDLIFPGHVVDRRASIRADGVRLEKVFIDRRSEEAVSARLESMGIAFESLFKKQAVFQINYY